MNLSFVLNRVIQIIANPKLAWQEIRLETTYFNKAFIFFLSLQLINVFAIFSGIWLYNFEIIDIIADATVYFIAPFLMLFTGAWAINSLSKRYKAEANLINSLNLMTYALTPVIVVSILVFLVRELYLFNILGLYSLYLMWTGFDSLLNLKTDRRISFIIIIFMVLIIVRFFVSFIIRAIYAYYIYLLN